MTRETRDAPRRLLTATDGDRGGKVVLAPLLLAPLSHRRDLDRNAPMTTAVSYERVEALRSEYDAVRCGVYAETLREVAAALNAGEIETARTLIKRATIAVDALYRHYLQKCGYSPQAIDAHLTVCANADAAYALTIR